MKAPGALFHCEVFVVLVSGRSCRCAWALLVMHMLLRLWPTNMVKKTQLGFNALATVRNLDLHATT